MGEAKTFTLKVTDECVATWMATNNGFTSNNNLGRKKYWNGVIFLLGGCRTVKPPHSLQWDLDCVKFLKTGQSDPIPEIPESKLKDPDVKIWINIVADKSNRDGPMTAEQVDQIFPPGDTFHKYFHPYPGGGGITFWHPHEEGITIQAGIGKSYHASYEFTVNDWDEFKVQVVGHAGNPTLGSGEIDRIEVRARGGNDGGDHGDQKNPPQMGGPG